MMTLPIRLIFWKKTVRYNISPRINDIYNIFCNTINLEWNDMQAQMRDDILRLGKDG